MIKKWITKGTKEIGRYFVFRHLKIDRHSAIDESKRLDFDVIQCLNWVNIVAINKDGEIILVKQYRHGTDNITLEIPGGAVDPGEDVFEAAKRELREETGYTSNTWKFLGEVHPNPAFMTNICQTYLALDCEQTHPQDLDPLEEVEVVLVNKESVNDMIKSEQITHSLVIAAFHLALINS